MEITFKFIIDKTHPKKDLTLPVRLRVYRDRNYKEHSIGFSVPRNDWNPFLQQVSPRNPDCLISNSKIASIKAKIQKYLLLNEDKAEGIKPEDIIKLVNRNNQFNVIAKKPDILAYGRECITKLQATGNIGNALVYNCALNKLQEYAKTDNLTFEAVNYKFIESFSNSMLAEGLKINSISNYLRTIRALFNKAIKDGTVEIKFYPFTGFTIKTEKTISRALTQLEMAKITSLDLAIGTPIWHQRNLFLLSYCFIGMNFADLLTLTKDNFVDGRIIFRRKKTHKVYSVRVQDKANELLSHYVSALATENKQFLLPFIFQKNNPVQLKKDILQAIKNCNDYLIKIAEKCNIDKRVTTYYARYSWANIARGLGYSKDLIAEALGHEYGNKVTGIYLDNYSNDVIDKMNEEVGRVIFQKDNVAETAILQH